MSQLINARRFTVINVVKLVSESWLSPRLRTPVFLREREHARSSSEHAKSFSVRDSAEVQAGNYMPALTPIPCPYAMATRTLRPGCHIHGLTPRVS